MARWASVNFEKIPIGLPVAAYDDQEYSAIVYGRGPLFFVALREKMGVQAFNAFLKDYTETLSWNIATPEFLQSLAEEHCTCDLEFHLQGMGVSTVKAFSGAFAKQTLTDLITSGLVGICMEEYVI